MYVSFRECRIIDRAKPFPLVTPATYARETSAVKDLQQAIKAYCRNMDKEVGYR